MLWLTMLWPAAAKAWSLCSSASFNISIWHSNLHFSLCSFDLKGLGQLKRPNVIKTDLKLEVLFKHRSKTVSLEQATPEMRGSNFMQIRAKLKFLWVCRLIVGAPGFIQATWLHWITGEVPRKCDHVCWQQCLKLIFSCFVQFTLKIATKVPRRVW